MHCPWLPAAPVDIIETDALGMFVRNQHCYFANVVG